MEDLHNVPNTGTFGNAVDKINSNFELVQTAISQLEDRTSKFAGFFQDASALQAAIPSPTVGMWADVGSTKVIYKCITAGIWTNTEETDTISVDVSYDVVNNLTSTSTTKALSAKQGKVLNDAITSLKDAGYLFAGVASPSASISTPSEKVFYLTPAGTYTNFGSSYTVPNGSVGVFSYNGSWSKASIEVIDADVLGEIIATFDSSDLDTMTTKGVYRTKSTAPNQYLLIVDNNTYHVAQYRIRYSNGDRWVAEVRTQENGTWTAWAQMELADASLIMPNIFTGTFTSITIDNIVNDGVYRTESGSASSYLLVVDNKPIDGVMSPTQLRIYFSDGLNVVIQSRYKSGGTWTNWVTFNADIEDKVNNDALWYNYYFNSSGTKTNGIGSSILIPVNGGDSITIEASDGGTYYGFLASSGASSLIGSRVNVAANTSATATAPSNARFMWIYCYSTSQNLAPKAVSINGRGLQMIDNIHADDNPRCVVSYNNADKQMFVYSNLGGNRYIRYQITLDTDTSELVYKYLWRVDGGVYCYRKRSTGEFFGNSNAIMHNAENEFTMLCNGKDDHTGGWHGDERIDIEDGTYVKFFLDGRELSSLMSSDFTMEGTHFCYEQYSTLHETTEDGETHISGHPIIAHHYKETSFEDGCMTVRNVMIPNNITISFSKYYSGLFCMRKYVAANAIVSGENYTGVSDNGYHYFADSKARQVDYYNSTNRRQASVWSMLELGGIDNDDVYRICIYDRGGTPNDLKYYRYLEPSKMSQGQSITTKMVIKFR